MNLPTVAIILEDHILGKIYGANKVVHLVNDKISDVEKHITSEMTGKQINTIYKSLDYKEQLALVEMDVYDEVETAIIINQAELLNSASDSEGKMSRTLRELIVTFGATLLVILAIGISAGYYESARQNNALIDSKLFSFASIIFNKISPNT